MKTLDRYPIRQEIDSPEEIRERMLAEVPDDIGSVGLKFATDASRADIDPLLLEAARIERGDYKSFELSPEDIAKSEEEAELEISLDTEPKVYLHEAKSFLGNIPKWSRPRLGEQFSPHTGLMFPERRSDTYLENAYLDLCYGYAAIGEIDTAVELAEDLAKQVDAETSGYTIDKAFGPGESKFTHALMMRHIANESRMESVEETALESVDGLVGSLVEYIEANKKHFPKDVELIVSRFVEEEDQEAALGFAKKLGLPGNKSKLEDFFNAGINARIDRVIEEWEERRDIGFNQEHSLEERTDTFNKRWHSDQIHKYGVPETDVKSLKNPLHKIGTEADMLRLLVEQGPLGINELMKGELEVLELASPDMVRPTAHMMQLRKIRAITEFAVGRQRQIWHEMTPE